MNLTSNIILYSSLYAQYAFFINVIDYNPINYLCTSSTATSVSILFNPYPTAFPYGNGMVLHFYQQQESSTTKTVHRVINKGLKTYV